jgi:CopA family copper-resistance protein
MRSGMSEFDRRALLRSAAGFGAGAAVSALLPGWACSATPGTTAAMPVLPGEDIRLVIGRTQVRVDGRSSSAVTINGTVPGPLLRLKEGQHVRIAVTNTLDEDTSIHWHGILLPFQMDGVPGVSFPGIAPGETFVYEFQVRQAGTYWYHSHSSLQEAEGQYGPLVIEPHSADPVESDREHVIVLGDHFDMPPHRVFERLKQQGGVFNYQKQAVAGLLAGRDQTVRERVEWAQMRMDPTDISDVTGAAATFLVNGHGPKDNWTGLFKPGERVRLRFINSAAQMIFNVRIPGLKLAVVAADGQDIEPVTVDEFQIGNGETYDVVVEPRDDKAYTLVAEAVDRSGMARGTLAPRLGLSGEVPPLRERPLANLRDMGMDMSMMSGQAASPAPPGFAPPRRRGADVMGASHDMDMSMRNPDNAPQVRLTPGVQMIAPMPMDRTGEPGQGLASVGHRVLVYQDLMSLAPRPAAPAPSRTREIRLTGSMERFMWGFDGLRYSDHPKPYGFRAGEPTRVVLVNDTMMTHPIHLHGHYFDLVHGPADRRPRKHTVNVAPGGKLVFDFTPEPGDWAFHCHMFFHMHAGMFQVFAVRPLEGAAA